jgi:hypothetical protein
VSEHIVRLVNLLQREEGPETEGEGDWGDVQKNSFIPATKLATAQEIDEDDQIIEI